MLLDWRVYKSQQRESSARWFPRRCIFWWKRVDWVAIAQRFKLILIRGWRNIIWGYLRNGMRDPEGWGRPLILLYIYIYSAASQHIRNASCQPEFHPLHCCLFYSQKQLAPTAAAAVAAAANLFHSGPRVQSPGNLYQINKYTRHWCAHFLIYIYYGAKEILAPRATRRSVAAACIVISVCSSRSNYLLPGMPKSLSHSACRRNLYFCAPIGPRVANSFSREWSRLQNVYACARYEGLTYRFGSPRRNFGQRDTLEDRKVVLLMENMFS